MCLQEEAGVQYVKCAEVFCNTSMKHPWNNWLTLGEEICPAASLFTGNPT
jgi:hypothetical protein